MRQQYDYAGHWVLIGPVITLPTSATACLMLSNAFSERNSERYSMLHEDLQVTFIHMPFDLF